MFPPKNEWIRHPMFHDSDVTNFLLKGNLSTIMANKFNESNELKLIMISPETLEVQKEIPLEIPGFYKKMSDDVYVFKKYNF